MSTRRRPRKPAAHDPWPDDPVVAEVRAIRAAMWKEAGGDINKYFEIVHAEATKARAALAGPTPNAAPKRRSSVGTSAPKRAAPPRSRPAPRPKRAA